MSMKRHSDNDLRYVEKEARRLAKTIQSKRKELGLSQEALAELVDATPTAIGYIEQGLRYPSFTMLALICRALRLKLLAS